MAETPRTAAEWLTRWESLESQGPFRGFGDWKALSDERKATIRRYSEARQRNMEEAKSALHRLGYFLDRNRQWRPVPAQRGESEPDYYDKGYEDGYKDGLADGKRERDEHYHNVGLEQSEW